MRGRPAHLAGGLGVAEGGHEGVREVLHVAQLGHLVTSSYRGPCGEAGRRAVAAVSAGQDGARSTP
jgi:hypothetical protein